MKQRFLINGKYYSSFPEEEPDGDSCTGCAFNNTKEEIGLTCTGALNILEDTYAQSRLCIDIIYKESDLIMGKKKLLIL